MTDYLDIAVIRIQHYLTRAPSLRGRRGASTMITEAARTATGLVAGQAEPNTEAGQIDGVVSLTLAGGANAKQVAAQVLAHLRARLPAASLVANLYQGEHYAAARRDNQPSWSQDWHPMVAEWPLAKPCDWCRSWPASPARRPRVRGDGITTASEQHCADCVVRGNRAGWATSATAAPGTERALLDRFPGRAVPDTFVALAELALGRPTDNTHLATIYADGNGIGRYLRQRNYPADAPSQINEATWNAVERAVRAIDQAPSAPLPIVPHLIGGDDVLVSVPAHGAWTFVPKLLEEFGAELTSEPRPSLSAGVVIHHRNEPLSDVVDLAGRLLKAAKRQQHGRAAMAWQSITHEGPEPAGRVPITLANWQRQLGALQALHLLAAAQRAALAGLCRDIERGLPELELDRHLNRMGLAKTAAAFRQPVGIGLDEALGIVRWWRS